LGLAIDDTMFITCKAMCAMYIVGDEKRRIEDGK
jgi:hypothetical protein